MDRAEVIEFARQTAEPAVTIMMPVEQPAIAHPDLALRLRALVDHALDVVGSWWGEEAAARVRAQLNSAHVTVDFGEHARGMAVLATPEDCRVLHLPFPVDEQVIVDRTFATRQLLQGLARNRPYLVLVLAGHGAWLFTGQGAGMTEVTTGGFPLTVQPLHEWDTPQRDLPIHEEAAREEHRFVLRAVDHALGAVLAADLMPVVLVAAERELSLFDEVTKNPDAVVGRVHGNFERSSPTELLRAVRPVWDDHRASQHRHAIARLREAYGRGRAVTHLAEVARAAREGRGHELVVEEGFTEPRHWVDGLTPGEQPDEQLEIDDVVDDVIEAVLLRGGEVEFVESGALDDDGHIGLILRYA